MGVSGIYGVLEKYRNTVITKDLAGKTVAIDANNYIYRSFIGHAMAAGGMLTSSEGIPTGHIKTLLEQIVAFISAGVSVIFVFDNNVHTHLKNDTLAVRRKRNEQSAIPLPQDSDMKYAKSLLEMIGIPYIQAPPEIEAEKICAFLTLEKRADFVLSHDPDALLFGATNLIFRDKKAPKNGFHFYNLENILTGLQITKNDLIKIGLILGTDFAKKTPRIGEKTVLKKFSAVQLTPEQQEAFAYFVAPISIPPVQTFTRDLSRLCEFLRQLDFSMKTIQRNVKKIDPSFVVTSGGKGISASDSDDDPRYFDDDIEFDISIE